MVDYEKLPKGYLKSRKKASMKFIISYYLFLLVSLLIKYGVIPASMSGMCYWGIVGLNVFMMLSAHGAKIRYRNIPIPVYDEIKVFTWKEIILYLIPVIAALPFIYMNMVQYIFIIGPCYVIGKTVMRPLDAFDMKNSRIIK